MNKHIRIFFIVVLIGIVGTWVFAIGQEEDVEYRADLASRPWEEIVDLAKQEGEVSWFVWYFQPQFREISQDFEELYGIKVTIPEGSLDANTNKAIAEKDLTIGDIDIISYGNNHFPRFENADLLYGPLNGIIEQIDIRKTTMGGVDSKGYALAYWGNQTGFAYDPARITESELPQTFEDIERYMQENPKLFSFADPNEGGSGGAFVRAVLNNMVAQEYRGALESEKIAQWGKVWEWFQNNRDYYVLTASNADSLTRLSDGEFIITAAWEDHLANLQKQGAINRELKFYIPQMGMSGGGNFASVLKNAPHPAAALLFLDWLTSKEVQTIFNERMGASPQNDEADDSNALIPRSMRQYATSHMSQAYEEEMRKQFIAEVLIQ